MPIILPITKGQKCATISIQLCLCKLCIANDKYRLQQIFLISCYNIVHWEEIHKSAVYLSSGVSTMEDVQVLYTGMSRFTRISQHPVDVKVLSLTAGTEQQSSTIVKLQLCHLLTGSLEMTYHFISSVIVSQIELRT